MTASLKRRARRNGSCRQRITNEKAAETSAGKSGMIVYLLTAAVKRFRG